MVHFARDTQQPETYRSVIELRIHWVHSPSIKFQFNKGLGSTQWPIITPLSSSTSNYLLSLNSRIRQNFLLNLSYYRHSEGEVGSINIWGENDPTIPKSFSTTRVERMCFTNGPEISCLRHSNEHSCILHKLLHFLLWILIASRSNYWEVSVAIIHHHKQKLTSSLLPSSAGDVKLLLLLSFSLFVCLFVCPSKWQCSPWLESRVLPVCIHSSLIVSLELNAMTVVKLFVSSLAWTIIISSRQ